MDFETFVVMQLKHTCKFYFLISLIINAETFAKSCNKIKIGEHWYEKDIFWSELNKAYNLNVHKSSNMLFFSYSVSESSTDMDFRLGHYNFDTKQYQTIAGIKGGCTIAIDQFYDDIYLGGSDGIYKFNMETKVADFYQEKGKNIWSLFFNMNLFYISFPEQRLHIQYDGKFSKVREFENIEIDHFHVTSNNDIYYANKTGFFKFISEEMTGEIVFEQMIVRQIVEDNEGDTYLCTNTGVFLNGQSGFKKILNVKNIYGLAFDGDNNLILSDDKFIIRLKRSSTGCQKKNRKSIKD